MLARLGVIGWALGAVVVAVGCGGDAASDEPPVATPGFTADRPRAALGSPLEATYSFVVADSAPRVERDYRVFVHMLDGDGELMWTDDHEPPTPTSAWTPGQRIEYSRTIFVPIYPYIGEAFVEIGLYSPEDGTRLPLEGEDTGQRAYRVGTLELLPQSENIFLIFKDGWHRAEVAPENAAVEWQWTREIATLSFRNPRRDALLYLEFDGRPDVFPEPQQVEVAVGDRTLATFAVDEAIDRTLQKIPLPAEALGTADMVDLTLAVDQTFVPAELPGADSTDGRELGIRVYHAFVQPQ